LPGARDAWEGGAPTFFYPPAALDLLCRASAGESLAGLCDAQDRTFMARTVSLRDRTARRHF